MADDVIKTLIAEAYAEGPEGMRRVAETILNRAAIRGITPEEVVRQAHQYTGLKKPGPAARKAWSDPKAISAAQAALELAMQPGDPTNGADHYYAPGSVSQPYWADSMASKGEYGGHKFYASRPVPPAELNAAVATLTDTIPRSAPAPVTPSPNLAAMRSAPRSLPRMNAGDSLALSPPTGGHQISPMFDGEYSPRLQGMTRITPAATWGMNQTRAPAPAQQSSQLMGRRTAASVPALQSAVNRVASASRSAPAMPTRATQSYAGQDRAPSSTSRSAPTPALQSSQLFGTRTASSVPAAQVAANRVAAASRPPARLPDLPPSTLGQAPTTRSVRSVPVSPTTASDRVRGNPFQIRELATTVATIPTTAPRSSVSASDLARGRGAIPDRLAPSSGLPANYGTLAPNQVATIGVGISGAPTPATRPSTMVAAAPKPTVAAPRLSPTPLPASARPTAVGTQLAVAPPRAAPPKVAPVPFTRPNFGIGGPDLLGLPKIAPKPVAPFAPYAAAPNMQLGLLSAILGPQRAGSLMGNILGSTSRAPVGAYLGTAANGGRMIQGHNGVMNSITQNSAYWKQATGQDSNGSERRREASSRTSGDASRGDHDWNN